MFSGTFKKRTTEHSNDHEHHRPPTATRVFDIEYGLINSYDANTLKSYVCMTATGPCIPIAINLCFATNFQLQIGIGLHRTIWSSMQALNITFSSLFCAASNALACHEYCCELPNQIEKNLQTSVSITNDGVEIVQGQHKTGCRCQCLDKGRTVMTIPFDQIAECEVQEPAGWDGFCWLVKNTVSIVTIRSTIARNSAVEIRGLTDPYEFKKLVLAMKRQSTGGIPVFAKAQGNDCLPLMMVREV